MIKFKSVLLEYGFIKRGISIVASRPVFISKSNFPYYEQIDEEFTFHSGFALAQKQRNIKAIHEKFYCKYPDKKVLEVSTKSPELFGTQLSAFNVMYNLNGSEVSLESIFQGSKVFENGGPYHDLYKVGPVEAKKDLRIKESGLIVGFDLAGRIFASDPKDYFYNWIYSSAIYSHFDYINKCREYDAFTDIEFNPNKSYNCQARTVAILRGLMKADKLDIAMESPEAYLDIVYRISSDNLIKAEQRSLFD